MWPTLHPKQFFSIIWVVTSQNSDWALCICSLGIQGIVCKRVVKVFQIINTDVLGSDIIKALISSCVQTRRGVLLPEGMIQNGWMRSKGLVLQKLKCQKNT